MSGSSNVGRRQQGEATECQDGKEVHSSEGHLNRDLVKPESEPRACLDSRHGKQQAHQPERDYLGSSQDSSAWGVRRGREEVSR